MIDQYTPAQMSFSIKLKPMRFFLQFNQIKIPEHRKESPRAHLYGIKGPFFLLRRKVKCNMWTFPISPAAQIRQTRKNIYFSSFPNIHICRTSQKIFDKNEKNNFMFSLSRKVYVDDSQEKEDEK